jgi:hypothetical protein
VLGEGVECRRRGCTAAQRPAALGPQRGPGLAWEPLDTWVAPMGPLGDPHLAAAAMLWPAFPRAEGIRPPIRPGRRRRSDQPSPRPGHAVKRGGRHVGEALGLQLAEPFPGLEPRLASGRPLQRHGPQERREKTPPTVVAFEQFRGIVVIRGPGQRDDLGTSLQEARTRHGRQGLGPKRSPVPTLVQEHLEGLPELQGCGLQVAGGGRRRSCSPVCWAARTRSRIHRARRSKASSSAMDSKARAKAKSGAPRRSGGMRARAWARAAAP